MRGRAIQLRSKVDGYRAAVEGHSPWTPDTIDARPIIVADAADDPSLGELRETILGEGIRALAFIPLMGARLLGKFMVYADRPRIFDSSTFMMGADSGIGLPLTEKSGV